MGGEDRGDRDWPDDRRLRIGFCGFEDDDGVAVEGGRRRRDLPINAGSVIEK